MTRDQNQSPAATEGAGHALLDEPEDTARIDLGPVDAARLADWCRTYRIPLGTMDKVIRKGRGPRCFRIGKLKYVSRTEWSRWLAACEAEGGTGRLSPGSADAKAVATSTIHKLRDRISATAARPPVLVPPRPPRAARSEKT